MMNFAITWGCWWCRTKSCRRRHCKNGEGNSNSNNNNNDHGGDGDGDNEPSC